MIKGLEHRFRLPRLGVIGLGVMVPARGDTKGHPEEVDYFVLPWPIPGLDEKPRALDVMFPSDDIEQVFPTAYVKYNARKLLTVYCDGQDCREIPTEGEETRHECQRVPGEPCPCGATAKGRLNVVLLNGPVGVYQIVIGGERRVADVLVELGMYRGLLGRLTGVAFTLERIATPTQIRDARGNRMSRTGWPVHIRSSITTRQALAIGGQAPAGMLGLPPAQDPHEEGADEQDAVATLAGGAPAQESLFPGQLAPTGTADEEWTIERCFAAALTIGVAAPTYRTFLQALYGAPADQVTVRQLAEQGRTLARAAKEPKYAETVLSRIKARVEGA